MQVDDANLVELRSRYVDWIIDHQEIGSDGAGWLGPDIPATVASPQAHDYWSKYFAIEAFESHAEANVSDAPRIVTALVAHHRQFWKQLSAGKPPLLASRWGFARYSDGLAGIIWLLDRVPGTGDTAFLWDLLRTLRTEADAIMAEADHTWENFFEVGDPFQFRGLPWNSSDERNDPTGTLHLLRHGVDIGQAMKTGALWWRVDGQQKDWNNPQVAIEWAERFMHMVRRRAGRRTVVRLQRPQ
jgi:hypothetical protein